MIFHDLNITQLKMTSISPNSKWPQYHPTQNEPTIPSPSIGIKSSDWGQVNMCGFLGQWTKYNCDNSFAFHTIFSSSNRIRIVTTSSEDCHCRPDLRSRLYSSLPGCRCCPPSSSPTTSWSWWSWSWCQCCLSPCHLYLKSKKSEFRDPRLE